MTLEVRMRRVREIGAQYKSRDDRARRLFVEERAASFEGYREREYEIKRDIAANFKIPYSNVSFCGSAQLGFSIVKERLFEPGTSDLDAACINVELYQQAWVDILSTTRAFSDSTPFGRRSKLEIDKLKDQILRRGMIRVDAMPSSRLKQIWSQFQSDLSRRNNDLFGAITIAIYMNEYAFCWKQDSALARLMRQ